MGRSLNWKNQHTSQSRVRNLSYRNESNVLNIPNHPASTSNGNSLLQISQTCNPSIPILYMTGSKEPERSVTHANNTLELS